jgi:hypothetical protein
MATVYADSYGFNTTDSTKALQNAINDPNADKIIVRNMGSPWLVSESISVKSNKTIVFAPGVTVQNIPGTFNPGPFTGEGAGQSLFKALNVENVKFIGQGEGDNRATLKMNREEQDFNHLIDIKGVKNYKVSGLKLTGAGGDGIHIAGGSGKTPIEGVLPYSENGLITNIVADGNRRQGVSIDSANGLTLRDSTLINTNGTAPAAGIDLEPSYSYQSLQNVKIQDIDIRDNNGSGIQMALGNLNEQSAPISVDIDRVNIDNSNRNGISVVMFNKKDNPDDADGNSPKSMPDGTINIRDTAISRTNGSNIFNPGETTAGILVRSLSGNQDDPNNLKVNFENVAVKGTGNGQFLKNPIYITSPNGVTNPQQVGNLSFKNVTVQDNFQRDIIRADIGRPDGYLNNVSGNIIASNPNGVTSSFDFQTPPQNFSLTVDGSSTNAASATSNSPTTDSLTGGQLLATNPGDSLMNGNNQAVGDTADQPWAKIGGSGYGIWENTEQPLPIEALTIPANLGTATDFDWKISESADLAVNSLPGATQPTF